MYALFSIYKVYIKYIYISGIINDIIKMTAEKFLELINDKLLEYIVSRDRN